MRRSVAWHLFERVADEYDQVIPFFGSYGASIMSVLSPSPGCRFLDLGAGRGALSAAALQRGCRVVAVDAASTMVARLVDRLPSAFGCVMDAQALALADGCVDLVAAAFVMHLLSAPERAAAEAYRVLAPGGWFALTTGGEPTGELSSNLDALFAEFDGYRPPGSDFGRPIRAAELLAAAGFDDIREDRVVVDVPVPDNTALWQWAMSHGYRGFIEALPDDRRREFQQRVLAMPPYDRALRRTSFLWSGRR